MRVLFVCHRWPYPPKRGGKIRPFNIISHLSQRHEVVVASLVRSEEEEAEGKGLAEHCHSTILGRISRIPAIARMVVRLPTPGPSSMGYFYSADVATGVKKLLAESKFDLIFVHCSSVAQYVSHVTGTPKILDFGDMDSQKWLAYSRYKPFPLSAGYLLEGTKMAAAEKKLARQFDLCTCTTRLELETLDSFQTGTRTDWFPNGVDAEFFAPEGEHDESLISFIGRMDYYPNQQCMLEFCRQTLPLIQARCPQARLTIVGADPSKQIRALADLPGVDVTGSVPDVRPHVRRSAVNVAPLEIARGTQNKILEAMAMGVPVVASTIATKGVDALSPDHLLSADGPQAVAEAVLSVLDSAEERQRLASAGRERVLRHHNWANSMQRLDGIIDGLLG